MNKKALIEKRTNHEDRNDNTTYNHIDEFLQDLSSLPDEWVDAIVKTIMYRIHEIWIMEGTATYHYIKAILENNLSPKESKEEEIYSLEEAEEDMKKDTGIDKYTTGKESKEEKKIEKVDDLSYNCQAPASEHFKIAIKLNEIIDRLNEL